MMWLIIGHDQPLSKSFSEFHLGKRKQSKKIEQSRKTRLLIFVFGLGKFKHSTTVCVSFVRLTDMKPKCC